MSEENQIESAPSLQISDLIVLCNLVQAAATRGAIRADEMQLVGAVYDKLVKFLTASGALTPAAESTATEKPTTGE